MEGRGDGGDGGGEEKDDQWTPPDGERGAEQRRSRQVRQRDGADDGATGQEANP